MYLVLLVMYYVRYVPRPRLESTCSCTAVSRPSLLIRPERRNTIIPRCLLPAVRRLLSVRINPLPLPGPANGESPVTSPSPASLPRPPALLSLPPWRSADPPAALPLSCASPSTLEAQRRRPRLPGEASEPCPGPAPCPLFLSPSRPSVAEWPCRPLMFPCVLVPRFSSTEGLQ